MRIFPPPSVRSEKNAPPLWPVGEPYSRTHLAYGEINQCGQRGASGNSAVTVTVFSCGSVIGTSLRYIGKIMLCGRKRKRHKKRGDLMDHPLVRSCRSQALLARGVRNPFRPCRPFRRRPASAAWRAFPSALGDHGLRGHQQAGDRGRVLQRGAHHLGGIDDALLDHVDIFFGLRVEAEGLGLVRPGSCRPRSSPRRRSSRRSAGSEPRAPCSTMLMPAWTS